MGFVQEKFYCRRYDIITICILTLRPLVFALGLLVYIKRNNGLNENNTVFCGVVFVLFICVHFYNLFSTFRSDFTTLPFQATECYMAHVVPLKGMFTIFSVSTF